MKVVTALLTLWLGMFTGPALAQEAVGAAEAPAGAPTLTASQREAHDLLMRMANFLAGLDRFSVAAVMGFDVVQENGLKIEFVEARDIMLDRPRLLRIEEESAGGRGQLVLFDGTSMTVYDGEAGVFAVAPQPETVDDAILYYVRELGMRLPLAPLLTTWAPGELERRVLWIDYVEQTSVFGRPAHHLVASTADIDFQVWVADGEQPLPLRMVLTYADAGEPQFWAQFTHWNVAPDFGPESFVFTPPEDAQQIVFAVQVPAAGSDPVVEAGQEEPR
jgi:hypothetical protein